jgi:hypothetical protein
MDFGLVSGGWCLGIGPFTIWCETLVSITGWYYNIGPFLLLVPAPPNSLTLS